MNSSEPKRSSIRNIEQLKIKNRLMILREVALTENSSRVELSQKLGYAKMTVSNFIAEYMREGIIEETGQLEAAGDIAAGRRRSGLRVVPGVISALGIYIARNRITASLVDLSRGLAAVESEPVTGSDDRNSLLEKILRLAESVMEKADGYNVAGIGVAAIGLIERNKGYVLRTTDFFHFDNVNIAGILSARFHLPVFLENDMKSSTLAEQMYGRGKSFSDFIFMGISNGVGGGVVIKHTLFEGKNGFSSEIGHMSVDRSGAVCSCSNQGCLELYASIPALLKRAGYDDWQTLLNDAKANVYAAASTIGELLSVLTIAIVNLANIFDPEAVIIGHEGAMAADLLFPQLERSVNSVMFQRSAKNIVVAPSALGEKMPSLGPAALVFHKVFSGALPVPAASA